MESDRLNPLEKETFYRIAAKTATQEEVENSLLRLTKMMAAHYGKPVILLVDEYDVPLAKADEKGYYPEMLDVVKGVMQVVKDNEALQTAVITGCLRIAKESIFTGMNNFVSDSIADPRLNEYFGFTQAQVDQLLQDTGLTAHASQLKEWYNGYCFGSVDVYCPWDVMNHINALMSDNSCGPRNFWENTSDNSVIRSFLDRADYSINEKFEILLGGGYIKETISDTLTYDTATASQENLWSLLYLTVSLTKVKEDMLPDGALEPDRAALKIPNKEIMNPRPLPP